MKKILASIFSIVLLSSCSSRENFLPTDFSPETVKKYSVTQHVFSKRGNVSISTKLGTVADQKSKQTKLNTYYFNAYCQGKGYYLATDTNAHLQMLNKSLTSTGLKLDANADGKITLDEINKYISSEQYIKYFRDTYITFSFKKLDSSGDSKLSVDEFNEFNSKVKDASVSDFQTLEEFQEYDYNSDRQLTIDEYEDFFMEYLLVKIGAN